MRIVTLAITCALVPACFSKPPDHTGRDGGGGDDAGIDAGIDGPPIDPSAPPRLAAGNRHVCRIDDLQRIICWGSQDHGQLGPRVVEDPNWTGVPALASNEMGWTSVATGYQHTCGVRAGAVYCWGENLHRQSAPTSSQDNVMSTPITIPGGMVERVVAGAFTTCAITVDHEVYCWGDLDFRYQMTHPPHPAAPRRLGTAKYVQVALADDHGCAIEESGAMHCWGNANQLQTGLAGNTTPVPFTGVGPISMSAERFTAVSAGHEATCAITTDQRLACWGSANQGQLGDVSANGHAFEIIQPAITWSAIAVGDTHTCGVTTSNAVHCWGDAYFGALGSGRFASDRDFEAPVSVGMQVSQIVASDQFTCALSTDGSTTKCWGSNSKGELGNRKAARKVLPTRITLPVATARAVTTGDAHTCILDGSANPSAAYCWGHNEDRRIGTGASEVVYTTPQLAVPPMTFTQISAGGEHTCGLTSGGTAIYCWGSNYSYQLGAGLDSATTFSVPPPPTPVGTTWTYVAAGSRMSCGITSDGRLICWGERPGLSGSSTRFDYGRPSTGWNWKTISIGSGFALGVVMNGSAPHVYSFSTPQQTCAAQRPANHPTPTVPDEIMSGLIPPVTTVFPRVAAAHKQGGHSCVHYFAGGVARIACFGSSSSGQLGGSTTCGNSPTFNDVTGTWPVPGATIPTAETMFTANDHSCALDDGGALVCWGSNPNFVLSNVYPGANPMTVSAKQWISISGGFSHTCGVDTDGLVWCWGENEYGQVGDGTSYEALPVDSGAL